MDAAAAVVAHRRVGALREGGPAVGNPEISAAVAELSCQVTEPVDGARRRQSVFAIRQSDETVRMMRLPRRTAGVALTISSSGLTPSSS